MIRLIGLIAAFLATVVMWPGRSAIAQTRPTTSTTQAATVTSANPPPPIHPATRPSTPIAYDSCVTPECHAALKQFRVMHGPINANSCDPCHTIDNAAQHTFKLTHGQDEVCTFCHKVEIPATAVVHLPYKDKSCLQCHNPHGGQNAQFLRQDSMRKLCATCHLDVVGNKSKVHGPVAADACGSCHKSHIAPYKNLLVAQGRELCFKCHNDMGRQLAAVSVVHKPVNEDCLKCHDVHASNYPMHIKNDPATLCLECHEPIRKQTESAHQHTVVVKDQACLNCHTAHGGERARLLKADAMNLCLKCHDKPIKLEDRTVASMKAILDPKKVKHGPVRDGNCGGCHAVHGSEIGRLLTKPYPETFYQPYAIEKYELCFSCHNKQLVETEETKGLTGFRNGEKNLHFLHVNRAEKGRNCRACHSTHASSSEMHIADKVPFGNWEMPINFLKTETGGSCSPGCHRPFTYDRNTAIVYEPAKTEGDK